MANTRSAEKAMRQATRATARKKSVRTAARSRTISAEKLVAEKDPGAAAAVAAAASSLDRAAKKGAIHRNAAARRKSRLARKLNAAQAKPAS